jgi:hypothetical protein
MSLRTLALALAALLVMAGFAAAAEVTRESYAAAVEPICKANTDADGRILDGVKAEVRTGKLKLAAGQFAKAAAALAQTRRELAAVPRPPADRARLASWLGYIKGEVGLFEATAAKLRAGQKAAAEHSSILLTRQAALANDQVLPFDFHWCRAEPSKFT